MRLLQGNEPEPPDIEPFIAYNHSKQYLKWLAIWLLAVFIGCLGVRCAHAQEIPLKASWYSRASLIKEGTWKNGKERKMANGHIFSDNNYTCATRLYPLGSYLLVSKGNKRVRVLVADRISKRFAKKRIDLSKIAFSHLADLKQGLINVEVERIN